MLEGTGFLIEGTKENGANRLGGRRRSSPSRRPPRSREEEPTYGASEREAVSWS